MLKEREHLEYTTGEYAIAQLRHEEGKKSITKLEPNSVLMEYPGAISPDEKTLTRSKRSSLT